MEIQGVMIDNWSSMRLPKQDVKNTLQYLAYKAGKPVSFSQYLDGQGYSCTSISMRVCVHDGRQATYAMRKVRIGGAEHVLAPEQVAAGLALVRREWRPVQDELNQILALVDHNRIIIPIEITAVDNDAARAILAHVAENAIPHLNFDLGEMLKKREEEFASQFTANFQQSVRAQLQVRRDEFDRRKGEAEEAYATIVAFERERNLLDQEIALLTGLAEKPQSPFERQQAKALLQIQESGQYTNILLNDQGALYATTAPIGIEYDGYFFPLGRYEIEIPANGDVRIKALDEHPNADHPHPHVARDYRPCLGNISGDLAKLIGKMRYAEALQMLHAFLSSYNRDNPYEKIGHFDPNGEYSDEDDNPCDDCDDKCSSYCIWSCEHNDVAYTCSDCNSLREDYCFQECEHNREFEQYHPCDDCPRKGLEACYLDCQYNDKWQLQDPCDDCQIDCNDQCPYHQQKEKTDHAKAG